MNKIILFAFFLLLLDLPSIYYVMGPIYKDMGLASNIKIVYAICAYACMIAAWPLINGDLMKAALVGICIYGTYGFTLAAVMEKYKITTGILELCWGIIAYTTATYLTNYFST
jgi:uncharacterized membrane protein